LNNFFVLSEEPLASSFPIFFSWLCVLWCFSWVDQPLPRFARNWNVKSANRLPQLSTSTSQSAPQSWSLGKGGGTDWGGGAAANDDDDDDDNGQVEMASGCSDSHRRMCLCLCWPSMCARCLVLAKCLECWSIWGPKRFGGNRIIATG